MPKKVMVIDDEPDIQMYLMAALEDEGYETCSLEPGASVESILDAEKPDLVVLDIMMPRRSGISIYTRLRTSEAYRHLPIVLISGMSSAKDFLPGGFRTMVPDETIPLPDAFVEKPVQIPAFAQTVGSLLDPHAP
ncbi:MAG: response regulator [Myxococcota bacterium]